VLDHRDGCTMSELAELTAVDRTTLTRTVDRMAAEGRFARRTDPRDRRSVRLHLTAAGRRAFERVLPLVVEQNERALDGLDERDLATLRGALRRMIGNLDHRPTDA
jgi:DNA-binding MarR family transcriptional regulator